MLSDSAEPAANEHRTAQPDAPPTDATPVLPQGPIVSERMVIFLVGAIQFVNILDFMMVMPLGPDFAAALGIATSHIGVVGGSYTAAAAVAGVAGSFFLDRFDRRLALGVVMLGLVIGTMLGGFATGLPSLLAARVIAGAFGGPATSISLAVVTDAVPPARRGKALGAVMGSFAVASVLGVPAGLELSRRFGWRTPFFAVAGLGLVLTLLAIRVLPSFKGHQLAARKKGPKAPLFDRMTGVALMNSGLIMFGVFAVVPNISAFLQHNLGYPRDQLGMLYLVGGVASFVCMRLVGIFVDRFGALPMVILGTLFQAFALYFGFIQPTLGVPILLVFTVYMLSGSVRMVPMQALATRVPRPEQRARFMSAQSAVQHLASAVGAMGASALLSTDSNEKLIGMENVALAALGVACLVPVGAAILERWLNQRPLAAIEAR